MPPTFCTTYIHVYAHIAHIAPPHISLELTIRVCDYKSPRYRRHRACSVEGLSESISLSFFFFLRIAQPVLTSGEAVVPPVSSAEIRFEIVGGPRDDHNGRCHQCPYAQEHAERQDDNAKPLQQARVRYFHGLRRFHSEDHGYPASTVSWISRGIHFFRLQRFSVLFFSFFDWSNFRSSMRDLIL